MDILLALDQGSSSSRTIAFDAKGEAVSKSQSPIRTAHLQEGWVEFDAEELLQTQTETLESVLKGLPKGAGIAAAGMACQRSTVVFWDSRTGKAVAPAISWQDRRGVSQAEKLIKRAEEIHVKTGLVLNPFYSLAKIMFTLENNPRVRKLRDEGRLLVGPVSTWLLWRWTKGEVFAADPTMAQRTLMFNIAKMAWEPALLKAAGLEASNLPVIRPSAGMDVEITAGGRKILINACLGDQQAAARGLGVIEAGQTAANYGTGAFLLHGIGAKRQHVGGLLTSVAWTRKAHEPRFLLEGTVNIAGTGLDWLKRLGLPVETADIGAAYGRSTHRVLALLALGGLGAPRWDIKVMTGFMGMRQNTRPEDLLRGALDSVAFLISDIADTVEGAGHEIKEVRVSGGLSFVDGLLQTQADLLQAPVLRLKEHERSALGAAALAADSAGVAFKIPVEIEKTFKPAIGKSQAARLKTCWKKFVEGYQAMSRDPEIFESMLTWQEQFE